MDGIKWYNQTQENTIGFKFLEKNEKYLKE